MMIVMIIMMIMIAVTRMAVDRFCTCSKYLKIVTMLCRVLKIEKKSEVEYKEVK